MLAKILTPHLLNLSQGNSVAFLIESNKPLQQLQFIFIFHRLAL